MMPFKEVVDKFLMSKPKGQWMHYRLASQIIDDWGIINKDDITYKVMHTCPLLLMLWIWCEADLNDDVVRSYVILFLMEIYLYIKAQLPDFQCARWGRLSSQEWVGLTGMAAQISEGLENYDPSYELNHNMMKDFFKFAGALKYTKTCSCM